MADQRETTHEKSATGRGGLALAATLFLFALIFVLTANRYAPPAPKDTSADATEFSAGRAMRLISKLVAGDTPRLVGSEANARGRQTIVAELESLGFTPEFQSTLFCNPRSTCAMVHNVMVRLPGTESSGAVMLMTHHDSVGVSPGAGDDAAGVGVALEIARILKEGQALKNDVFVVFTDAEEQGLFGANAFAEKHPWAREVRAVVNLEARGTSGASLMFETGPDNAKTISAFAGAVRRPVTSSVFSTIYDNMPNDTDFSVFKRQRMAGFNFAFVGNPENYHRPSDSLENLDVGTVQHQGDNALSVIRALAASDLETPGGGNAVFFDLLAWTTISWPGSWTLPLAVLTLLLFCGVLILLLKRGRLSGRQLTFGAFGWWGMTVGGILAVYVLNMLLNAIGAIPSLRFYAWIAEPRPAQIAFAMLALAVTSALARWLGRGAGFWGIWAGVWIWWSLIAVALAATLPGVSYLFLVPTLAAAILGAACLASDSEVLRQSAAIAPAGLAALLWCALLTIFLYPALGTPALMVVGALIALVATTITPLVAQVEGRFGKALPLGAAVVMLLAVVGAATTPHFTAEVTRPYNLRLHQDADTGVSQWLLDFRPAPPSLMKLLNPTPERTQVFPWWGARFRTAEAITDPMPGLELAILEETVNHGQRSLRAHLSSPRGATVGRLYFPPGTPLTSIAIAGTPIPSPKASATGWRTVTYLSLADEGVEVEIGLGNTDPVEIVLGEQSMGLPPVGDPLLAAMPANIAPIQAGHLTLVNRRVKLELPEQDPAQQDNAQKD